MHHWRTSIVLLYWYWWKSARTFRTAGNKIAKNEGATTLLNKLSLQPSCVKFFYRVRRVLRSGCLIAHHTSITRWRIGNEQTYFQFSVLYFHIRYVPYSISIRISRDLSRGDAVLLTFIKEARSPIFFSVSKCNIRFYCSYSAFLKIICGI